MAGASPTVHPEPAILALFAAGSLRDAEMARLEEHLIDCAVCLRVLEHLPEDPMVGMLRAYRSQSSGAANETPSESTRGEETGPVADGTSGRFSIVDEDSTGSSSLGLEIAVEELPRDLIEHSRYRVRSVLGRGGMGLVFLAEDRSMGRPVVLKFLRDDLLDHPCLVERFRREGVAAARLKHPNIVEALGTEQVGRWPALVLEYLEGTDLARLVARQGPVPVSVGCELIRQAALGLQYSSEEGMVHRDIKPSNLMVTVDGKVKILDFGLARMHSELSAETGLTGTGAMLGSVDYMAPEQADDPRLADIRGDIYSLGCTLYHLLSGSPPFRGSTFEVLEAHHSMDAPLLSDLRPEVPAELAALVARMMAKDPERRFQTPGEVARTLEWFLSTGALAARSPDRTSPPRFRPVLARAVVFAAIVMGTLATKPDAKRENLVANGSFEGGPKKKLIVNGSFEDGPEVGDFLTLEEGSTAITGWTVTRGQIDYNGPRHGKPADGERSLDLRGSTGCQGIEQTFKTSKARRYRVTFSVAGSLGCGYPPKMVVRAAGDSQVFAFDLLGHTIYNLGWITKEWEFDAVAAQTTLEICAFLPGKARVAGLAVDNVRVEAVPR